MKRMNNRSGFTLLEIIIVIIIVGVLASLALPRFFQTIAFSRSTEALNAIGVLKRATDRCALMAGEGTAVDFTNCDTLANIGVEDPGLAAGAFFDYTVALAGGVLTFTATSKADVANVINVVYDTAAGTITRNGTGDFSGIK